jgi:hypothetical protein
MNKICSGCGSFTNQYGDAAFWVGVMTSLMFTPFAILAVFLYGFFDIGFWFFFGIVILCLLQTAWGYRLRIQRREIHLKHLATLPEGLVPVDQRPGHHDFDVETKLQKYKRRRSGIIPIEKYYGLKGLWWLPVLSLEEMTEIYTKFCNQLNAVGGSFILIGIGIIGTRIYYFNVEFELDLFTFWGIGILFILIGLFTFVLALIFRRQYKSDARIQTTVGWKHVGRKAAFAAIEEFLKQNNEHYKKLKVSQSLTKPDTTPAYKYIFDNGNHIFAQYVSFQSGMIYGFLAISYTFPHYIQAKSLQVELDAFLAERDMIETL